MAGNLIIVSAPSGAGKTTLVTGTLKQVERLVPSISYTSRAPRRDEETGAHYHFVTRDEFKEMIARGEFLEWAEVHGNFYGTPQRAVEELRGSGKDVILTIDVQGAENARRAFPDAISIFILPPSYEVLVERLKTRGANHDDDLQLRLRNAQHELEQYRRFDYLVINDELEQTTRELAAIILAERCRLKLRTETAERILQTFAK